MSAEQLKNCDYFRRNGFVVQRNLLDADKVATLSTILKQKYLGENLKFLRNDVANNVSEVTSYIWDKRVTEFVASAIAGPPKFLQSSDFQINHNVPGWHRDSPSRKFGGVDWQSFDGPYSCVKCILYFEAADFGLGVVPGSHVHPIAVEAVHKYDGEHVVVEDGGLPDFGYDAENWRTVNVLMRPGDAIVFDQRLFHRGWPTAQRTREERRMLNRAGEYKYSSGKITLALCFGLDNFHSNRYYSAFRFHRKDLKYTDLAPALVETLREKGLLLSKMGQNLFEDDADASMDLYTSLKDALAVDGDAPAEDVVFELPRARKADSRIKREALTRPFIKFANLSCPVCRNNTEMMASNYPSGNQEFFANLTVIGCRKCGFAHVPNRVLGLSNFRKRAKPADSSVRHETWPGSHWGAKVLAKLRGGHEAEAGTSWRAELAIDPACGYGVELARIPASRRIGIEPFAEAAVIARQAGVEIVADLSKIASKCADFIVADRWIETLLAREVVEELSDLRRKLKPDGVLLLRSANASLLCINNKRKRHSPNLSFFSAQSLRATLTSAEFSSIEIEGQGATFNTHKKPAYEPDLQDDIRQEWLVVAARP